MGTTTITLDQQKVAEINQQTPLAVQQAESYLIETEEDYEASLPLCEEYKRRVDMIIALFEGTKDAPGPKTLAFQTHRSLSNLQNQMTAPYLKADETILAKRKAWRRKVEEARLAAEAEARRVAEAKRQEEIRAEQTRLAKEAAEREADRKRQADELKAEAARLKAEGDKTAAKVLQEQAANVAALAEKQKLEDAELAKTQIEEMAKAPVIYAPEPLFNMGAPKQKGSSLKKPWTFRVLKPELFPVNLLLPPDEKKLDPAEYPRVRKLVQALGANHGLPDGCIEAYQDDQESIRRK
jgi:hypothetical protein